ncbi:trans-2,3-enoyl-CoA reductase-like 2b [Tachysurus vachellii]|uniref:trans-2,3-enoyl-CoA reductase-like 2b n=1 Tax=Tachysurus vachellii TaxID=175792 RepID=UPI00296AA5EB|nr:trans-2,3-enoyl-CoA reductase-like 2b [Tachysurus vachellii]
MLMESEPCVRSHHKHVAFIPCHRSDSFTPLPPRPLPPQRGGVEHFLPAAMDSLELKDLFTVAQFIKARCDHGLKAGEPKNIKNYVFFEVEILDPKTRTQLCYLDKVDPSATVGEIKTLLHRLYPKWYPARQALKLHPEGKALKDDDVLEDLPVGTTATMFLQDLGPQLGWTMVFLSESIGPLFIYLLFYYRLPFIYSHEYDYTQSSHAVVRLACVCHTLHYVKRLAETIFIHRFSHGTLPLHTIALNCLYYWGFAAWLAYYINHPLYTTPMYGKIQIYTSLFTFLVCECGNFSIHLALNRLSCNGSRPMQIPYPSKNPFTWLFFFVSCPNYTYELGSWISLTVMTQCVPVAVFTLIAFVQMTIWARGKHKTYIQEFREYPELRSAIIPLFL